MNEIVNKFLLAGDKFMPEMHWRQPGFTFNACGPFTKNRTNKKIRRNMRFTYIYQSELDKVCFQYDIANGDFKYLNRKTFADKYCTIKHLILLKIQNMTDINVNLLQWFIKSFWQKKTPGSGIKNIPNKQLTEELHKSIIRKINKRKKHSPFVDNISGAYLADMQLISKSIKDLDFYYVLLMFIVNMIGLFLWKIKKGITITNAFQNILDESNRKPNKIG